MFDTSFNSGFHATKAQYDAFLLSYRKTRYNLNFYFHGWVPYIKICQQREVITQEGAKIGPCFRKFHTRYPKHQLRLGNNRFWTDTIDLENGVYTKECWYFIECNKTGQRNCGIQIVSFSRIFVCDTNASFVVRHTSNHIIFLLGYNYSSG